MGSFKQSGTAGRDGGRGDNLVPSTAPSHGLHGSGWPRVCQDPSVPQVPGHSRPLVPLPGPGIPCAAETSMGPGAPARCTCWVAGRAWSTGLHSEPAPKLQGEKAVGAAVSHTCVQTPPRHSPHHPGGPWNHSEEVASEPWWPQKERLAML